MFRTIGLRGPALGSLRQPVGRWKAEEPLHVSGRWPRRREMSPIAWRAESGWPLWPRCLACLVAEELVCDSYDSEASRKCMCAMAVPFARRWLSRVTCATAKSNVLLSSSLTRRLHRGESGQMIKWQYRDWKKLRQCFSTSDGTQT